jgi:hypothetical protein
MWPQYHMHWWNVTHRHMFKKTVQLILTYTIKTNFFFAFFFWWRYWDLNSGLCTCLAGFPMLKPHIKYCPPFLLWLFLRQGFAFCHNSFLFMLLAVAEMTGAMPPSPAFFCWYEISWTFSPGWPQISILLISASQVARITGVSHWHLAKTNLLNVYYYAKTKVYIRWMKTND